MVPHKIINEVQGIFESYYLKYWRIYVTLGVTLVYILLVRSLVYVLPPVFLFNFKKEKNKYYKSTPLNNNLIMNKIDENSEAIKEEIETKFVGRKRKVNLPKLLSITSLDNN